MKKIMRVATLCGVFLLCAGCGSGKVTDKRAPGQPSDKVFQLHVEGTLFDRWVTVSEETWDACGLFTRYPSCAG
jgi:hypothetical protein